MNFEINNLSYKDEKIVEDVMSSHNYKKLKNTQRQAFSEGILDENNRLLVAETGNGKTLCAESLAKKRLQEDKRVAYLVPSTQLVRDKKRSIEEWISAEKEVSTGSGKYHHGDIVVATFKSFYHAVLRGVGNARSFDLAILDDFHELYGDFIGPGLEKSIAAIKKHNIEIFSMSATIGNPREISDWLDAELTVSDSERSIPIEEDVVRVTSTSKKETISSLIKEIKDETPILVFNYAKSWTESRAKELADLELFNGPDINVEEQLENIISGSIPSSLQPLIDMVNNGVAYHHSSLPIEVRQWIEDLYQDRDIKCLFATTTIAYGFDSPVQTVVVADMKRRGNWIGKWEYQQWIGRAARPGYGYDVGYAYSVTNNPETVLEEYFKPRELEPIKTHINSPETFRILILELITMGWKTPDEIEEFIQETLYWKQMSSEGAWGRSFGNQNKRLRKRLKRTVKWLEDRGFVRENRTEKSFESTNLGDGSVDFIFESGINATLTQIYNFYRWCKKKNSIEKLELLAITCEKFDLGLRKDSSNNEVESMIINSGLNINSKTITAGILHTYWAKNLSLNEIEKKTNINGGYLESSTYRISKVLRATENIIESTDVIAPNWIDTYSYRIQRGIMFDEVPYIRNVKGLGRSRIRSIREYLESESTLNDPTFWSLINERQKNSTKENIVQKIVQDVEGIGNNISEDLIDYHNDNYIPEMFRER